MKIIGKCPACDRDIESGDDVVEVKGVAYHEGCEPAVEPVVTEPVVEPVVETKGKKMSKQDEMLAQLVALVGDLSAQVASLKANQAATPTAKKAKSEKGAPRPDVYYVIKGFPSEKRPPQCLKVYRAIAQAAPEGGRMTETDIWNALMDGNHPSTKANKNVGSWNYAQTPYYIFKYYRADMINAEYVSGPFDVV